jgi:hypothetical protein
MHTTEQLVLDPTTFEDEISTEEFKDILPGVDHILAEFIQAGGKKIMF